MTRLCIRSSLCFSAPRSESQGSAGLSAGIDGGTESIRGDRVRPGGRPAHRIARQRLSRPVTQRVGPSIERRIGGVPGEAAVERSIFPYFRDQVSRVHRHHLCSVGRGGCYRGHGCPPRMIGWMCARPTEAAESLPVHPSCESTATAETSLRRVDDHEIPCDETVTSRSSSAVPRASASIAGLHQWRMTRPLGAPRSTITTSVALALSEPRRRLRLFFLSLLEKLDLPSSTRNADDDSAARDVIDSLKSPRLASRPQVRHFRWWQGGTMHHAMIGLASPSRARLALQGSSHLHLGIGRARVHGTRHLGTYMDAVIPTRR